MKKINAFLLFCLLFCMVGCSDDDDPEDGKGIPPPVEEGTPEPAFSVSASEVGIFEKVDIGIRLKDDPDRYTYNLSASNAAAKELMLHYDSVVWNIKDIFSRKFIRPKYLASMPQTFILPGEYKIYVDGYIDGKVYSTDTTKVKVGESKDFLGIDWSEDNAGKEYYYFTNYMKEYYLTLSFEETPNPHSVLGFRPNNINSVEEKEKYISILKSSRKYLYDYITGLYGNSVFTYEGEDITQTPLEEEYGNRFKTSLTGEISGTGSVCYPLAIWETETTYMALVAITNDGSLEPDRVLYAVIAEPR